MGELKLTISQEEGSSTLTEEDDDIFRAPTIVAEMQEADFHQHSMVTPPTIQVDEPEI